MVDYPRVGSCCGRPLFVGCIIIGIICVILGVLLETWYLTNLFSREPAKKEEPSKEDEGRKRVLVDEEEEEQYEEKFAGEERRQKPLRREKGEEDKKDKEEKEKKEKEDQGCVRQGRRHLAYGVTYIFLGILIIVGVKEEAHWMILMFTWIVLSLGIFIFSVSLSYLFKDASCAGITDIFWGIVALVCGIVFSIISLSYFREVKEATEHHLDDLLPPGVLPEEAEDYRRSQRESKRRSNA